MSAASNINIFTGLADSNMSDAMGTFLGKMNELFPMNRMATGNIQSAIIGNNPLFSNKARVYIRALPDSNDKNLFLAMFNYLVDPIRKTVAATALTALTAGSTGAGLPPIDPLAARLRAAAASGGGTPAVNLTAAATGGTGLLRADPSALTMRRGSPAINLAAAATGGTGLFSAGPLPAPTTRRGTISAPTMFSTTAAAAASMPLAPAPLAPAPVPTTCVPSPEQYSAVVAAANAMQGLVAAMAAARTATAGGAPPRSKWNPKSWVGSGGARKSRKHSGLRNRKTQRRK